MPLATWEFIATKVMQNVQERIFNMQNRKILVRLDSAGHGSDDSTQPTSYFADTSLITHTMVASQKSSGPTLGEFQNFHSFSMAKGLLF
jgi:hypothetical protein